MGLLSFLLGDGKLRAEQVFEAEVQTRFAVDSTSIPPEFFGLTSYGDPVAVVGKVKRSVARQVPAVKRARDLIAGTLGTIPMQVIDTENVVSVNRLLDQPENDVPRSVTFTRLFEDLLYDGIAYWRRVENDYRGYPVKVQRIDPECVEIRDGRVWVKGRQVSDDSIIRFDSPNGPLLGDGARAIRTLLRLEAAAATQSEDPVPQGFFSPTEGADPLTDEEVITFLTAWKAARRSSSTAYVPAAMKYESNQFSPKDLQLIEARQHAVLEIARLTGIAAEDLSVSVTSRNYLNGQQARQERINDVLGPFSMAVTDRLRMRDITPIGYEVRADFTGFLRADDKTRLENYATAKALGLLDLDAIAQREGLPAPQNQPANVLPAAPAPREIER